MKNNLTDKIIDLFIVIAMFAFLFCNTCHLPFYINKFVSLLSFSCLLLTTFFYIFRFKFSKSIIFLILYFVFGIFSCYIGKYSDITLFFKAYYPILGIALLIDSFISTKTKLMILTFEKLFFILIFINWITLILYPNGLYSDNLYTNNWFLLYDNLHILIYIPGLITSMIASEYKKNKFIFYIILFLVTYSVLFCMSATSVVGFAVILIFYFLSRFSKKAMFASATNYLYIYISIFIGIVYLRMQNIFKFFIVDYLHKDLTFSARTFLWDKIINYIYESPLFGYGIEYNSVFTEKMGSPFYTHAHNTIYDILYKGGIISLGLFMGLILLATKELNKFKDNIISRMLSVGLFSFYMMMNFESRQEKIGLYILIFLSINVSKIIKSVNEKRSDGDINA